MDSVIWLFLLWVLFMYVGGAWGEPLYKKAPYKRGSVHKKVP